MPSSSTSETDDRPGCPSFAPVPPNVEFSQPPDLNLALLSGRHTPGYWKSWHWQGWRTHSRAVELVTDHLLCTKVLANSAVNPYLSSRGFQLVFFEITDGTKHSIKTPWKTGELFHEHVRASDMSSQNTLRRSAFSVRNTNS